MIFKSIFGWIVMGCTLLAAAEGIAVSRSHAKPMVVILLGPPGAGKGTHAGPLSEHLSLPHISTGDLFREHIKNDSPLGQKAKSYMNQGHLVPDELVLDMLFERMKGQDCAYGCILDGVPRTVAQAEALDVKLGGKSRLIALNFNVPDSILIERIAGRVVCKDCKKPYHKRFDPPSNPGQCDVCGGSLISRPDDEENIVRKRLEIYHRETQPLIEFYAEKNGVLREIDSQNAKEQVFDDVIKALPISSKVLVKT